MSAGPKISIVTIVRNDAEGLLVTARSVLQQDYDNIEWIVVDGASTDGTAAYIQNLAPCIADFKSEADSGIYNAMNKGIDMVTGDWMFFLNADDIFFDEHTPSDYVMSLQDGDDIVYADALSREDRRIHQYRPEGEYWLGMTLDHQTACVRTEIDAADVGVYLHGADVILGLRAGYFRENLIIRSPVGNAVGHEEPRVMASTTRQEFELLVDVLRRMCHREQ